MLYERISGFADEISPEVNVQLESFNRLNISFFEPRGIEGKNIADITDEELRSLKENMDKPLGMKLENSTIKNMIKQLWL